ncbi:hypothetical protein FRC91_07030 [Bradymonadales bacterium TMQ1]|nr:hypothetical protein FRC91_07030 [Bradymonadales bacterium TMQ1]
MINELFESLATLSDTFEDMGTAWALVGGLAVSCYVDPRFTRDIDVAVAVRSDADAESFLHAWQSRGYVISAVIEQDAVGRLSAARTTRAGVREGIFINLLFASSGIEPEIVDQAQPIAVVPDVVVPVARPGHLFALKLLSESPDERPQDAMDLNALRDIIAGDERIVAREALRLIAERGFARGRDLSMRFMQVLGDVC